VHTFAGITYATPEKMHKIALKTVVEMRNHPTLLKTPVITMESPTPEKPVLTVPMTSSQKPIPHY
jgi:hypothetical protein